MYVAFFVNSTNNFMPILCSKNVLPSVDKGTKHCFNKTLTVVTEEMESELFVQTQNSHMLQHAPPYQSCYVRQKNQSDYLIIQTLYITQIHSYTMQHCRLI
jgi:hypothetical protein